MDFEAAAFRVSPSHHRKTEYQTAGKVQELIGRLAESKFIFGKGFGHAAPSFASAFRSA